MDIDRDDLQTKALTPQEAGAIINAAYSYCYHQGINDKWNLYFKILWQTGLRLSEVLLLKVSDIQPDHMTVHRLKKRKAKPEDIMWIKPNLYADIWSDIVGYGLTGRIFPNSRFAVSYVFNKLKKRTGIRSHLTVHGFRHGFAFNYFAQFGHTDQALVKLQRWMGHENVTTTMRYLRKGVKDLKADLDLLRF